ncbi:DUF4405 domain-containing protein [bacterium]|nr:DUF4405 domain-containing protein [bacterium]
MDRSIRLLIDLGMLASGLVSAFSGFVLWFGFPADTHRGWQVALGLYRFQWENLHFWTSLVFVVLAIVHFALNWKIFLSYFK